MAEHVVFFIFDETSGLYGTRAEKNDEYLEMPYVIFRKDTDLEADLINPSDPEVPAWAPFSISEFCRFAYEDDAQKAVVAFNEANWHPEAWDGMKNKHIMNG